MIIQKSHFLFSITTIFNCLSGLLACVNPYIWMDNSLRSHATHIGRILQRENQNSSDLTNNIQKIFLPIQPFQHIRTSKESRRRHPMHHATFQLHCIHQQWPGLEAYGMHLISSKKKTNEYGKATIILLHRWVEKHKKITHYCIYVL